MDKSEQSAALRTLTVVFAAVLAGGVLLALFTVWVPGPAASASVTESLWSLDYWGWNESKEIRSEIWRNILLSFAAITALVIGTWRAMTASRQADITNDQARIAERGHFTERFTKAAEMLGEPVLAVRTGSIYALWQLVTESPNQHIVAVLETLCAFARFPTNDANINPPGDIPEAALPHLRKDVQIILDLIFNVKSRYRALLPNGYEIHLDGAILVNAKIENGSFFGASLRGADLSGASVKGTSLKGVDFSFANLKGADLTNCNLAGAVLQNAKGLTQAQLDVALVEEGGSPPALPEGLKPPVRFGPET